MKRTMVRLGMSLVLLVAVLGLVPRAEAGITPYNPCRTYDNHPAGCYYTWSPQDLCCYGNHFFCADICY